MKYNINFIKMLNLGIIILTMNLFGCSHKDMVTYYVDSNYTGYCVIFLKPNINMDFSNKIIIKAGFAKSNMKTLQDSFLIKYLNSDSIINVVQIGDENLVNNDETKHVFDLGNGFLGADCDTTQIHLISFFVGKKTDYINWRNKYNSEFDYLNALDSNWCNYYKSD